MFVPVLITFSSLPWQRLVSIPCALLATAALHSGGEAVARHRLPSSSPPLDPSQRQALFKVRRDWLLKSYPDRLAMLQNEQRCLESATTPVALQTCKQQKRVARRALAQQGRDLINTERRRLGLAPLPERDWRHAVRHEPHHDPR